MSVEVPDGWREATIADIATLSAGGTPKREIPEYYQGGNIPWVKSGELRNGTIFDTEEKITEEGLANSSTKLIPANTPIIAMYGATAGVVGWLGVKAATNQAVLAALVKPEVNSRYVYHLLLGASAKLIERQQGGAQPNLSKQLISSFPILLPPLPEQQRIAEILSSVDESIRATEAVIAQAERVKRGLMEDLLTGGLGSAAIANGEVPDGWDLLPLGSIARIFTGKTPSTKEPENWGGKIPFVTPTDLNGSVFIGATERYLTDHGAAKLSMLPANSVLYTCIASIGKSGISTSPCVSNQQINSCVFNDANNPVFHYYQLQKCTPDLDALAGKTAVSIINKSKFSEFEVLCPPLAEQQRIAAILSSVDDQITTNRATVEQLQRLKRGLMDDLLTGKVRTVA